MQPQSKIHQSTNKINIHQRRNQNTTAAADTSAPTAKKNNQSKQEEQRKFDDKFYKLVKGRRPLQKFKFYLDIRDHQQSRKVEEKITALGGSLEFFLTDNITHFITDKQINRFIVNSNNQNHKSNCYSSHPGTPQTPATPGTPLTPCTYESTTSVVTNSDDVSIGTYRLITPAVAGVAGGGIVSGSSVACGVGVGGGESNKLKKQSRADAMLNRARHQSQNTITKDHQQIQHNQQTNIKLHQAQSNSVPHYKIWDINYAFLFLSKVSSDLKKHLANNWKKSNRTTDSSHCDPILLKNHFIKIESLQQNYRPYYQVFKKTSKWPRLELNREDGAFRISPPTSNQLNIKAAIGEKNQPLQNLKKNNPTNHNTMTRKSRSSTTNRNGGGTAARTLNRQAIVTEQKQAADNQTTEKQCGVCEICKIEYDTLTIHLKTKDHEFFAKNTQNFLALDSLIKSSANVNKFLDERSNKSHQSVATEVEVGVLEEDLYDEEEVKEKKSKRSKLSSKRLSDKYSTTLTLPPPAKQQKKVEDEKVSHKKKSKGVSDSSPVRTLMPTSSLYKVVESKETFTRSRRDHGNLSNGNTPGGAVGSSSLIVKIRKVRQTALSVLNGEAENFMFPKRRNSYSEVPTDGDRQTTSENTRHSVSSLSTSEHEIHPELDQCTTSIQKSAARVKNSTTSKRRSKNNKHQKRKEVHKNNVSPTTTISKDIFKNTTPTPPIGGTSEQSFRKTPIQPVARRELAALLSSSLNYSTTKSLYDRTQLSPTTTITTTSSIIFDGATRKSSRTATAIVSAATNSSRLLRAATANNRRSNCNKRQRRLSILGDRMGEEQLNFENSKDEFPEDVESCDDIKDEDYIDEFCTETSTTETDQPDPSEDSVGNASPQMFDIRRGQQLPYQLYSFERVPRTELWYKVFDRQDNGAENIFEYYGNTKYKKLPYEMGPIPFKFTTAGINANCQLCLKSGIVQDDINVSKEVQQTSGNGEPDRLKNQNEPPAEPPPLQTYHKHKTHHLYRYRQEQDKLHKQISKEGVVQPLSKDSTPDPAENTNSNSSSCPSNLSCGSSKKIHNKLLNKSTFLNMEVPPRKSPREHASTLAILSCLIKQRQDSVSKPNSETDEPRPGTPVPITIEDKPAESKLTQSPLSPVAPRNQTTTPVEEMKFVSVISENVKRLRRGLNKYDEAPVAQSFVIRTPTQSLEKSNPLLSSPSSPVVTPLKIVNDTSQTTQNRSNSRRSNQMSTMFQLNSPFQFPPQVKKTAKKKTGLEFELDAVSLKALKTSIKNVSVLKLEREIDKFLQVPAIDPNEGNDMFIDTPPDSGGLFTHIESIKKGAIPKKNTPKKCNKGKLPPTFNCFSSDINLIDLLDKPLNTTDEDCDGSKWNPSNPHSSKFNAFEISSGRGRGGGRRSAFNFFSSSHNYFKKRKYLKANRTGWPKSKRRVSTPRHSQYSQHQQLKLQEDIQSQKIRITNCRNSSNREDHMVVQQQSTNNREALTPPDTDIDDKALRFIVNKAADKTQAYEIEDFEEVASTPDDNMEELEPSQGENDDEDKEYEEDDDEDVGTAEDYDELRQTAISSITMGPMAHCKDETTMTTASTTPLVNGYMSPSEKADNSDIFTVSSDGLETDLDLSNSQLIKTPAEDPDGEYIECEEYMNAIRHTTSPKRKYITSATTGNSRRSTCTPATATSTAIAADVKSLAISNILTKEVKVSCRRLRAPFRRYRCRR